MGPLWELVGMLHNLRGWNIDKTQTLWQPRTRPWGFNVPRSILRKQDLQHKTMYRYAFVESLWTIMLHCATSLKNEETLTVSCIPITPNTEHLLYNWFAYSFVLHTFYSLFLSGLDKNNIMEFCYSSYKPQGISFKTFSQSL